VVAVVVVAEVVAVVVAEVVGEVLPYKLCMEEHWKSLDWQSKTTY
jgi:hypothetical protein